MPPRVPPPRRPSPRSGPGPGPRGKHDTQPRGERTSGPPREQPSSPRGKQPSSARGEPRYDCFAIAAPGLEPVVARELAGLAGLSGVKTVAGGVEFRTDAAGLATAQLQLRTASRVIVRLAHFKATAFHELERAARQVEWGRVLAPGGAFRLRVTCRKSRLYHSDAVAERVAAAIVRGVKGATFLEGALTDEETDDAGEAGPASVGTSPAASPAASGASATLPPQLFVVRFDRDQCTISADASGELLHRRGYRQAVARAPMRETLAAAMLLAGEWDPRTPLVDPMCGSGTIAIEAALLARGIAPGLGRAFAAEAWPEMPAGTWAGARATARAAIRPAAPAPIVAADRDAGAIAAARANAARAGVEQDITFACAPLSALEPPPMPGALVCNPPYGVRVGDRDALRSLYAAFGRLVRERLVGWRVVIVAADPMLLGQTGLGWSERLVTRNGGIGVRVVSIS